MLPRQHRATGNDFLKKGRRTVYRAPHLSIEVTHDPQRLQPTIACVVSKKVARQATERNLLKRRCRQIMREILPSLPKALLVVRLTSAASYPVLREEIKGVMSTIQ